MFSPLMKKIEGTNFSLRGKKKYTELVSYSNMIALEVRTNTKVSVRKF